MTTFATIFAILVAAVPSVSTAPQAGGAPSSASPPAARAPAAAHAPARGDDAIVDDLVIAAPIEEVWAAIATKAGLEAWMAPHVEVDLRLGGTIRSHYEEQGTIGDPNTMEMSILALQPPRMLSMRATRFPRTFPLAEVAAGTWGVFLLDDLGDGRTRLSLTGYGYHDDDASQALKKLVQASHRENLEMLRFHLEKPAAPAPAPATPASPGNSVDTTGSTPELAARFGPAARLVGGEWRIEAAWADGSPLKARQRSEWSLDGHCMRSRLWVTKPDGSEYQRYETLWKPAEPGKTLKSTTFAFNGAVTEATTMLEGDDTLVIPPHGAPGGAAMEVRESLVFENADTMRWTVWAREDATTGEAGWKQMMAGEWKRVR